MGEAEHEGDHVFGRGESPIGSVRLLQAFTVGWVAGWLVCDIHPQRHAAGLHVDSAGFGWQLCEQCERERSGT